MGYIANNLIANERIVFHSRFHWWSWGKPFMTVLIPLLLLGGLLMLLSVGVGAIVVASALPLSMLVSSVAWFKWYGAELGVTNRRVIIKRGVIVRHIIEMTFNEIESSRLSETLWGRIMGYQRILLQDYDGTKTTLNLVRDAQEMHERILEQLSLGRTLRENQGLAVNNQTQLEAMQLALQMEYIKQQQQQTTSAPPPKPAKSPPKATSTPPKAPAPTKPSPPKTQPVPVPVTPPKTTSTPTKSPTPTLIPLQPLHATANPAQHLRQASLLIQQNKRQEALTLLKQILEQDNNNADAWYLMGTIIVEPNRKRNAFIKALRANPQHQLARQALANWK